MYVFQIFDFYAASGVVLLTICFSECICVGHFYGADKFYEDIKRMVGFQLTPWFKYCWLYFAPIVTLVRAFIPILIRGFVFSRELLNTSFLLVYSQTFSNPSPFFYSFARRGAILSLEGHGLLHLHFPTYLPTDICACIM